MASIGSDMISDPLQYTGGVHKMQGIGGDEVTPNCDGVDRIVYLMESAGWLYTVQGKT